MPFSVASVPLKENSQLLLVSSVVCLTAAKKKPSPYGELVLVPGSVWQRRRSLAADAPAPYPYCSPRQAVLPLVGGPRVGLAAQLPSRSRTPLLTVLQLPSAVIAPQFWPDLAAPNGSQLLRFNWPTAVPPVSGPVALCMIIISILPFIYLPFAL